MADTRLTLALRQGLLPEWAGDGPVLWFGLAEPDLPDAIPPARLTVVQPLQPACDVLCGAGIAAVPEARPDDRAALAIVSLPRARARAQLWIAQAAWALGPGGLLIVDGAKTDGVDTLFKACRGRLTGADSYTKAHGRVFWGHPGADLFADWLAPAATGASFVTGPGVFSADGIDPASALLAQALPGHLRGRVADLGAGWGYLSREILTRPDVTALDLVEADHVALQAARRNIDDPRAAFHWADATAWRPSAPWDAVVMNPPFHTARAGDPALGRAFIAAAARGLVPKGQLWLVANRHLPYEAELETRFRAVEELKGSGAFKLFRAEGPRPQRKGA
ncbi:MAG: class I SAM-dependent methyltransferase [Rhodobacteraceae bacterium]|nr:class I SAM-dependent methyltransferase [Paracoccaceae bacterium]